MKCSGIGDLLPELIASCKFDARIIVTERIVQESHYVRLITSSRHMSAKNNQLDVVRSHNQEGSIGLKRDRRFIRKAKRKISCDLVLNNFSFELAASTKRWLPGDDRTGRTGAVCEERSKPHYCDSRNPE